MILFTINRFNMPDTNESNRASSNSTILKTVAGVALGAAVAFGAYFMGKTDGHDEAKQSYQQRVHYAQNMTPKAKSEDDVGDEKIERDCDICRVSFKQLIERGVELHSTSCGHIFCKNCIDASLRIYARCPACNEDLLPGQTHRIFL